MARRDENQLAAHDRPVHDWYRFVLSFPPHLIRSYIEHFGLSDKDTVLDPFCGTGTTLVEAKKLGLAGIGLEANPMAFFATDVKTSWDVDPLGLYRHASEIAEQAIVTFSKSGMSDNRINGRPGTLRTLPWSAANLLLKDSISALPLHKVLVLLDLIKKNFDERFHKYEMLALARALPVEIGNLKFGPEVGLSKTRKDDASVVLPWLGNVKVIANDLELVRANRGADTRVFSGDAREMANIASEGAKVQAVITSPPYPNEKDYTRTTRLESVILGFLETKEDLRALKKGLLRSNTRNVYVDDDDDKQVASFASIQDISQQIERRREELGKTSGFERLYHRVAKLYFGGMTRHFEAMKPFLAPGARLAYVVGDQASYLRVMIRTGTLLAEIAEASGYKVENIDLFRTRPATVTGAQLREEVVLLTWPGH